MHPAQIVDELRSRHSTLRVRGNAIGRRNVDERAEYALVAPGRQLGGVAKVRIGFAESEVEGEVIKSDHELIHQVGRKYVPVTYGQVLADAAYLSQGRKSGKDRGACVKEVPFRGVVVILQIPDEEVVVIVESVVHANHIIRPRELRRRVPVESGSIEAIAHRGKSIRERYFIDQPHDRGVRASTPADNISAENVVAGDAVRARRGRANRNSGKQIFA